MPPEPLPWDRRDLIFREKKHDRGAPYPDALGSGGSSSTPRWRETCPAARDFPAPSPRRPHHGGSGSGSGYHDPFPEDPCSRSEDKGFRSYQSGRYAGGGYQNNNNREAGGCFRRSSWDSGDLLRQKHDSAATQGSVADSLSHPSSHLLPYDDKHDDTGGGGDHGMRAVHRQDRDLDHSLGSLAWKSLKWNRSSSFSSSSKVLRSESDGGRLEVLLPPGRETPIESPVASPLSLDEDLSRKKQRLGWGQGLAKYERAKTEVSDEVCGRHPSQSDDASPRVVALPGNTSPATPASITCSSSHGGDDKVFSEVANSDAIINLCNLPGDDIKHFLEEFSINSEFLDLSSLSGSTSVLAYMLHPEDASSADSCFMRQTAMNKLLLVKDQVLKQLEKTELDIDLFEYELKKLKRDECKRGYLEQSSSKLDSDSKKNDICQISTKSPVDDLLRSPEEHTSIAAKVSGSSPVLVSAVVSSVGTEPLGELYGEDTVLGGFSPGTVKSDFRESVPVEKGPSDPSTLQVTIHDGSSSVMPDADLRFPSVVGSEQGSVHGGFTTPGLGASGCPVFSAMNFGQDFQNVTASIIACNQESAKKASQVLDAGFSSNSSAFQTSGSHDKFSDQEKELLIRSKIGVRKCFLKFKEKLLALKYRAFQHLWKEDLQLLHIKKHRSKSHRRIELNCRSSQNVMQKSRSFLRSKSPLSGGMTLVPTPEILEFTGRLLSDSHIKVHRNILRMPALILDEKEKIRSRFITNNGLVEDPCSYEKERSMINPWTPDECKIFMEMLAIYGKDFAKISSFLNHKTTADCIEFYYKNHKSEDFEKVKKSLGLRKTMEVVPASTYLVTSSNKWKREINAVSLDVLRAASMIAAQDDDNMRVQKFSGRSTFQRHQNHGAPSEADILMQEQETSAADVLVGICGAVSRESMSYSGAKFFDSGEKTNFMVVERRLPSEASQLGEGSSSDEGCDDLGSSDWTDEEKSSFISALSSHGRDFARISHCVGSRSMEQCKIFFSKARKCLGLDAILSGSGGAEPGRNHPGNASRLDMDSAACTKPSGSKIKQDFTHSSPNACNTASVPAVEIPRQADPEKCIGQQREVGVPSLETLLKVDDPISVKKEDPCFGLTEGKALKADIMPNGSMQRGEFSEQPLIDIKGEKDASHLTNEPKGLPRDDQCLVPKTEPTDDDQQKETSSRSDNSASSSSSGFTSKTKADDGVSSLPEGKPLDLLPGLHQRPHSVSRVAKRVNARPQQPSVSEDRGGKKQKTFPCREDLPSILGGYPLPAATEAPPVLLHDWPKKRGGDTSPPEAFLPDSHRENGGGGSRRQHELRPCSNGSFKGTEQPVRTGDVKIFGKILSHPSPPQRPSSPGKSATAAPRGLPATPEPGAFLAKYPPSYGFVRQAYMPTFSLDGGRCDAAVAADVQKKHGGSGGFQHQGRVGLGHRVPGGGGGGMLLGSKGCTGGISDPVAAIKLHYAARAAGVLAREEESWRADVGR
ncbi:unnamed protein product [Spirodela intermedia]|uniref:SANT domain-containing protein n=1 Tax=Spirodela intermedia TaxID=51605 RepID=A0A7I8IAR1_SPIIN|nr:unnamed protein product [Spirodela intermedia]CAA6654775.1 unnamed protein product [Spirodela intermedia]